MTNAERREKCAAILKAAGWNQRKTGERTRMKDPFEEPTFPEPPLTGSMILDAATSPEERFPPLGNLEVFDNDLFDIEPSKPVA